MRNSIILRAEFSLNSLLNEKNWDGSDIVLSWALHKALTWFLSHVYPLEFDAIWKTPWWVFCQIRINEILSSSESTARAVLTCVGKRYCFDRLTLAFQRFPVEFCVRFNVQKTKICFDTKAFSYFAYKATQFWYMRNKGVSFY